MSRNKNTNTNRVVGPASYANWRAQIDGQPTTHAYEAPLYSDAYVVGEFRGAHGPYHLFNNFGILVQPPAVSPKIIVRVDVHLVDRQLGEDEPKPPKSTETFTGTHLEDEIACLCSLAMGARFAAGGVTHRYGDHFAAADPRGRPSADHAVPSLPTPPTHVRVLPGAFGEKQLSPEPLALLPKLKPDEATVLLRAARAYRDALWLAESEPQLSWLLLVSAIEAVAVGHKAKQSTEELVAEAMPDLAAALRAHGDEALRDAAKHLAPLVKSTARFLGFMAEFPPPVPSKRPPAAAEHCRLDWTPEGLRRLLNVVYRHRSKALHESLPFPPPMCEPPWWQPGWDGPSETGGPAVGWGRLGGRWSTQDVPFTLHTFEYIARHALLGWWTSRAASNE